MRVGVIAGEANARQIATAEAIKHVFKQIGPADDDAASFFLPNDAFSFLTFSAKRLDQGGELIEVEVEGGKPGDGKTKKKNMQSYLTSEMEKYMRRELLKTGPLDRRAHMKSRCAAFAHVWKTVVGSTPMLLLTDSEMQSNVRVEYGLPAIPAERLMEHCNLCQRNKDYTVLANNPCHFLTCQKTRAKEVIRRHNEVCNLIGHACRELSHHATVESSKINGVAIDSKRVDLDMLLRLKTVLADVTIRCSAKKDVDAVMEAADKAKTDKYRAMAVQRSAQFVPLAFDAFGGFSPTTQKFFDQVKQSGVPRSSDMTAVEIMRTMRQEISVAIHRYNGMANITGVYSSLKRSA